MKIPLRQPYRQFFGTLANQVRLDIMKQLVNGPQNVSALVRALPYSQPTISHSLARLHTCGFVTVTPNGRERTYSLNEKTIHPLFDLMHHHMIHHCCHVVEAKEAKGPRAK